MTDRFNHYNADDDRDDTSILNNLKSPNGNGNAGPNGHASHGNGNGRTHPLAGLYPVNGRNGTNNLKNSDPAPRPRTTDALPVNNDPFPARRQPETGRLGQPAPASGQAERVLNGSLAAFSPSSLLSLLNIQKQTGYLYMRSMSFEGYIYLDKGEVYDAGIARVSNGALAVFQLFGWRQGEFSFEIGAAPPERRTIEASLPVLQVRATLWLDSMNKYSPIVPSPAHRISIAAEPRSEVVIEPYQWAVLTKIVSRSLSVAELAAELGQDLMTVTRITAELVKMGVAIVLPPDNS